jgi:hypothetical protein
MVCSRSEVRSSRISTHGASGWVANWTWGEVEWKSSLGAWLCMAALSISIASLLLRCPGGDVVAGAVGSLTWEGTSRGNDSRRVGP